MTSRSTTSATTTAKRTRTAKPKTEPTAPAEAPAGRVVANVAQPARLGFSTALKAAAEQSGWTFVPVADPDPSIVHIYGGKAGGGAPTGGAILTHKDGQVMRVSFFATRDGSSDRLDAAYLWLPGATSGRRVQTVYQVMATLAAGGKEVAGTDPARKRATVATTPAEPVAEVKAETPKPKRTRTRKAS